FNAWQTAKACAVLAAVVAAFVFSSAPREVVALGAAGLLLMSRRMHSREVLGLVDWHLLVLFIGLFAVNHAFAASGALDALFGAARGAGFDIASPAGLFAATAVLSNLVSNVPA